jgi:hypothetical protein
MKKPPRQQNTLHSATLTARNIARILYYAGLKVARARYGPNAGWTRGFRIRKVGKGNLVNIFYHIPEMHWGKDEAHAEAADQQARALNILAARGYVVEGGRPDTVVCTGP